MPDKNEETIAAVLGVDGEVVITVPSGSFDKEQSVADAGMIHLYLTQEDFERLYNQMSACGAEQWLRKAEVFLTSLPRDSIRRDLGRAGVKFLRRAVDAKRSKEMADHHVAHALEVLEPVLKKFGLGQ